MIYASNKKGVKEDVGLYGIANIQQYKTEMGFRTLAEGVSENLYVVPDFQRVYRWKEDQVENLAVSLIRGMPIPPIYAYRNSKNQLVILDGQQRILSMYFYYIGKYTKGKRNNQIRLQHITQSDKPFRQALEEAYELKDKKYIMRYYEITNDGEEIEKEIDITYNTLPKEVKRKLDFTSITVIEISIDNIELNKRYLYKIFANLNAGGTLLTNQELRNGIYKSDFYDMLFDFNNENNKWRKIFGSENKFSKDIECLLRFCALKYFVEANGDKFVVKNYKNFAKMLDDFSEKAVNFDKKLIDEYRFSLEKFLNSIPSNIPNKVTLLESIFTVMDKKDVYTEITEEVYKLILANNDYKDTVKVGTASKSIIEKRLKAAYDEISKYVKCNNK